jgi:hypothetical protein
MLIWGAQTGVPMDYAAIPPTPNPKLKLMDLMNPLMNLYKAVEAGFMIVIVNSLDQPLKKSGEDLEAGQQVAYPATTDFGKHASKPDEIPAARPDLADPSSTLHGVAVYCYETDNWATGAGALSFSTGTGGPTIAVMWQLKYGWNTPVVAVTANLLDEYDSLNDFFTKAAAKQGPKASTGAKANLHVSTMSTEPYHFVVWVQDPAKK